MNKYVLGDIHGNFLALQQCIKLSGIDKELDLLIVVGDVVDGLPQTKDCIEELLTFKNLIFIKGNHDEWFQVWGLKGDNWNWSYDGNPQDKSLWTSQGGQATIDSYGGLHTNIPKSHLDLIVNAPLYYIDDENRVFVHGGFDRDKPIEEDRQDMLMWDRDLWYFVKRRSQDKRTAENTYTQYSEVFIGHTQINAPRPQHCCNVWNLDTAAGWSGQLTIMDIDSKEFWQSDSVGQLYPQYRGR
jgi:serine/threonine protein phosphatase 1